MNKKIFIVFFTFFITLFLIIALIFSHSGENYKESTINGILIKGDKTRYKVKLIKKVDGDTIIVNFNNKELKYGPEASELNGKLLSNANNIEIEFDIYEKEDKYHRALCYVYADGKSIQEQLLLSGLAEIKYVKPPDTRYLDKFKKAQNKAKSNKRNLWSNT